MPDRYIPVVTDDERQEVLDRDQEEADIIEAYDHQAKMALPDPDDFCPYCCGHGADPLSDNVNWLTCPKCGGSGKS